MNRTGFGLYFAILRQASKSHCDIRARFATVFRNWRFEHKIPLKRIAGDLRIAVATVNSWESGKSFPTGHHFEQLTDYTGLLPCQLFCGTANKCVPADCLLASPKLSCKRA